MDLHEQVIYYDKLWSERKQLNSLKLRRALKILDYFVDIKKNIKTPRVLDLGCGDGRFSAFVGEFSDVDAIDLSVAAVKEAQVLYPHVNFFQGSAVDYNFEVEKYDVIISQEVIEHIEDQKKYIEVCAKTLKRGGYLIITTPNKRVFEHMEGGNWSRQPIENILNPSGFKNLISSPLKIVCYDSIIYNFGSLGYFKFINNPLFIKGSNLLGLQKLREYLLSKLGFGLHQCILARKA